MNDIVKSAMQVQGSHVQVTSFTFLFHTPDPVVKPEFMQKLIGSERIVALKTWRVERSSDLGDNLDACLGHLKSMSGHRLGAQTSPKWNQEAG